MPVTINPQLDLRASDTEPDTSREAEQPARQPIVDAHVALMLLPAGRYLANQTAARVGDEPPR